MAALRKPEVARIPVIQERRTRRSGRMAHEAHVGFFPGKAEVMAVSITRDDPDEAQDLVKAVVDSYLTEVVNAESERKQQRLTELEKHLRRQGDRKSATSRMNCKLRSSTPDGAETEC